jgi:hypothetical protein
MNDRLIRNGGSRTVPIGEIAPEVLRKGGSISFIATGGSMWPHIRHGDYLVTVPLPPDAFPGTGWVIVYLTAGDRLAVHRVVGKGADGCLLVRGDAHAGTPEPVPRDSVLGRVVSRKRRGRKVDLTTPLRNLEGRLIARSGSARILLERTLRALKPGGGEGRRRR